MTGPRTVVVLARHGRTAWHDGNRYTGSSDLPIDEVGQRQAEQLSRWALDFAPTALWASSMLRAQQTAAPVAAALGLETQTDPRFREVDFGSAEGRRLAEIRAESPAVAAAFEADPVDGHFPGGEHPAHAAERAHAALLDVAGRHPGERVLVVAHNTLIRLLTCRVLGLALRDYRRLLPELGPAALVRLRITDGQAGLESFNAPPVPVTAEGRPHDGE